jgi:aerobic-type carbon monoxide dehydrogenase small subunit (CoxS/CutS family)
MLGVYILENRASVDDAELKSLLAANICRCTGYVNIIAAMKSVMQ